MLKSRIIPVLLCLEGSLVKGQAFDSRRRIGIPLPAVRTHKARKVDELIFLDVGATCRKEKPNFALIEALSEDCFMPLTVGGGVHDLNDIRDLLSVGADKVCLNTAAVDDPSLINRAAEKFGNQCVVVSIDTRSWGERWEVVANSGKRPTGKDAVEWAVEATERGAGELLVNVVHRDGMMTGYDLALVQAVSEAVSVPVIACGGAGEPEHCVQAVNAGASAVAAGAMFAFTDFTPQDVANHMAARGLPVRRRDE